MSITMRSRVIECILSSAFSLALSGVYMVTTLLPSHTKGWMAWQMLVSSARSTTRKRYFHMHVSSSEAVFYRHSDCGSLSMLMAQVMGGKRQALGEFEMGATSALKILVANKSAGSIIGKAGSTINAIKETSGARVKVSSRCCIHALYPCQLPRRPRAAHSQKGACVAAAPSDVGVGRGVRLAGSWLTTLGVCWVRSGCVVDVCVCKREAGTVVHTDSLGTAAPKSSLAPTIVSSSYKVVFWLRAPAVAMWLGRCC
jgi:hypothetical protein